MLSKGTSKNLKTALKVGAVAGGVGLCFFTPVGAVVGGSALAGTFTGGALSIGGDLVAGDIAQKGLDKVTGGLNHLISKDTKGYHAKAKAKAKDKDKDKDKEKPKAKSEKSVEHAKADQVAMPTADVGEQRSTVSDGGVNNAQVSPTVGNDNELSQLLNSNTAPTNQNGRSIGPTLGKYANDSQTIVNDSALNFNQQLANNGLRNNTKTAESSLNYE